MLVDGYTQLQGIQMVVIYNKKPELIKKRNVNDDNGNKKKEIFNYEEIREMNTAWTECAFNQERLDKFFAIEKLQKKTTIKTFIVDVAEKSEGASIFDYLITEMVAVEKLKENAAKKA